MLYGVSLLFVCYQETKNAVSDTAYSTLLFKLVPRPGVEPGRVAPLVFETSASTDSAIWARKAGAKIQTFFESAKLSTKKLKNTWLSQ